MTKSQNKETVSLFGIEIENKKYDTKALVSLLKEKFDELETVGHISYFVQAMKQKKLVDDSYAMIAAIINKLFEINAQKIKSITKFNKDGVEESVELNYLGSSQKDSIKDGLLSSMKSIKTLVQNGHQKFGKLRFKSEVNSIELIPLPALPTKVLIGIKLFHSSVPTVLH